MGSTGSLCAIGPSVRTHRSYARQSSTSAAGKQTDRSDKTDPPPKCRRDHTVDESADIRRPGKKRREIDHHVSTFDSERHASLLRPCSHDVGHQDQIAPNGHNRRTYRGLRCKGDLIRQYCRRDRSSLAVRDAACQTSVSELAFARTHGGGRPRRRLTIKVRWIGPNQVDHADWLAVALVSLPCHPDTAITSLRMEQATTAWIKCNTLRTQICQQVCRYDVRGCLCRVHDSQLLRRTGGCLQTTRGLRHGATRDDNKGCHCHISS